MRPGLSTRPGALTPPLALRSVRAADSRSVPAAALMLAVLLWTVGCGEVTPPITTCEASGGLEPICGFQNPEDLALLPDGHTLVVSQFGAMDGARPGNLAVFDTVGRQLRVVFRGGGEAPVEGWGEADCPGPPDEAFAPHGLDLAPSSDGRLQLLVVNHGGREAIEFFEVVPAGLDTRIEWRGCAIPPDDSYLNDVVATPEGGLLTTHMLPKSAETLSILRGSLLGSDTGWIYEWTREGGWKRLPGTDAPFPNGIDLSSDARTIFVNVYLGGEVRRIDRRTGEVTGRVAVSGPDNMTWSSDGRLLLVASHHAGIRDSMNCMSLTEGSCGFAFEIVAIDPETLERRTVVANEGPPMGAATVALQVGNDLWLGTFAGDRVTRVVGGAPTQPTR